MNPSAEALIIAARAAGATVLETAGAIVFVLPVAAPSGADLLPLADAARVAATSVRVVRDAIRAGALQAVGGQRDRAVRRGDVEVWIEGRRVVGGKSKGDDFDEDVERILARRARTGT